MKLAYTLMLVVAVAAWRPAAAAALENDPGSAPVAQAQALLGSGCQLLSSSPNGYVAVASQAAGAPAAPVGAQPQGGLRAACSTSDNNSCNVQCINSGWRGGYCCCSCGTVSLCTCWR